MSKESIMKMWNGAKAIVTKRSPEILTGLGIVGMVGAGVLAVSATPKALRLIEEKKKEERKDELKATEVVATTWKCYIPAVTTAAVSVACLIGASSVNARHNAALAAAYKLSEAAFTEYKDKVVETIGEKKEKSVKDAIAKDKIEQNPINNNQVIVTGGGKTRCYDASAGRYFESDMQTIRTAVNNLNEDLNCQDYVSLNDFYDELGLPHTKLGELLGWNRMDGLVSVDYSTQLDSEGIPCLVISYENAPRYDYYKYG